MRTLINAQVSTDDLVDDVKLYMTDLTRQSPAQARVERHVLVKTILNNPRNLTRRWPNRALHVQEVRKPYVQIIPPNTIIDPSSIPETVLYSVMANDDVVYFKMGHQTNIERRIPWLSHAFGFRHEGAVLCFRPRAVRLQQDIDGRRLARCRDRPAA